jgi:signal transduction histidine kinase
MRQFQNFVFVFWFLQSFSLHGQGIENKDYFIKQYTDDSGLPQNSVKAIMKDENGFVWLTTEDGIARFDGQRFSIFNKTNVNISSNRFAEFVPIMGTKDGPAFNFAAKCATGEYVTPLKNGSVAVDKNFFPKEFINYSHVKKPTKTHDFLTNQHAKSFLGNGHNPFLVIGNDNTFIWTNDSIFYFRNREPLGGTAGVYKNVFVTGARLYGITDDGRFVKTSLTEALRFVDFSGDIRKDKDFNRDPSAFEFYWSNVTNQAFMAIGDRLYMIEETGPTLNATLLLTGFDVTEKEIVSVFYDQKSKSIFMGSSTMGFFVFIAKQFEHIKSNQAGADNVYYAQMAFHNNTILSVQGSILSNSPAVSYPNAHFYNNTTRRISNKYYIAQAKDSTFWLRISNILYKYSKDAKTILASHKFKEGFKALALDDYGVLWIAADQDKLYALNTRDAKAVPVCILQAGFGEITQMVRHSTDQLLLGTKKGLYQYNLDSKCLLSLRNLAHADIRCLLSSGKDIWISTYGDGIYLWSKGKISKFPLDKNDFLATSHCITEDNRGFFWITTNKGLFQVWKKDLLNFADGRQNTVFYLYYDKRNGFASNEFNGGCQPCSVKLANGTLSLPSINGLVWFKPDSLQIDLPDKKIFTSHIDLDGQHIGENALMQIPRHFRRLSVSVNSPYFGSANNLQFDYAIQSGNKPAVWLPISDNFSIEVPNTVSGKHMLMIRKRAGFGSDNFSYLKLPMYIVPAWYESPLFKGFLALMTVFVLWQLLRLRTTYLIKKERRKNLFRHYHISNQIVAAINHDIQTPLHYISNSVLQMKDQLDKTLVENDLIAKISQETVNTIERARMHTNNLLNYLKSQSKEGAFQVIITKVDVHEVVWNSCQLLSGTVDYRELTLTNQIPKPFYVRSDGKLLSVIVHNLIDNAVKLSDSSVTITSGITDKQPHIMITDTASGMPEVIVQWLNKKYGSYSEWIRNNEYPDSRGLGIIMVKDLCTLLKIDLQVSSISGAGSTIKLTFPASEGTA